MCPALAAFLYSAFTLGCFYILLRRDDEIGEAVVAYTVPYVVGAYSNPIVWNADLWLLDLTC